MTDIDESTAAANEPATKEKKVLKNIVKPCWCSVYEVGNFVTEGTADEELFTTGCTATTQRTFAQGHDARLISFLVDGHFDGYSIRTVVGGVARTFPTPADAVADVSNALQTKAEKAVANRLAKVLTKRELVATREAKKAETRAVKEAAKAEREAKKAEAKAAKEAAAPKATGAEVVAGSVEGDTTPPMDGEVKIKVGRWEYNAEVDPETGVASYVDGKGEVQTVERDGYRLLG